MVKNDQQFIPPKDLDDLYEGIMKSKQSTLRKVFKMARAIMGMRVWMEVIERIIMDLRSFMDGLYGRKLELPYVMPRAGMKW